MDNTGRKGENRTYSGVFLSEMRAPIDNRDECDVVSEHNRLDCVVFEKETEKKIEITSELLTLIFTVFSNSIIKLF